MTTATKKMGNEISRLIGIAQELKREARTKGTIAKGLPPFDKDKVYELMKRQRDEAVMRAAEAERQVISLKRAKLANFSLDEIGAELERRVLDSKRGK